MIVVAGIVNQPNSPKSWKGYQLVKFKRFVIKTTGDTDQEKAVQVSNNP